MEKRKKQISKKTLLLLSSPFILIIILVLVVKVKFSFFNDVKEKLVESQFYCDKSAVLKGKKCILVSEQSNVLLGNVNLDDEVNQEDVDLLSQLVSSYEFNDHSYVGSDINGDGIVDENDLVLLENYVHNGTNEYEIGIKKMCPMDSENISNYLSETKDKCVQVKVTDANKKGETESIFSTNGNNNSEEISTTYEENTVATSSRNFNTFNNSSTDDNEVFDTNMVVDTATSYQSIDTSYPSTNYNPYDTLNTNYYDTQYYTNDYDYGSMNEQLYSTSIIDSEDIVPNNKGNILYTNGSLIKIEEIEVPDNNKEYQYNDVLNFQLKTSQQGTGLYYYTVNEYTSTNKYNNGYLTQVSNCKRLKTNNKIDLNMIANGNNKHIEFNVYADKNCRSQRLVAKYISNSYTSKINYIGTKKDDKIVKIDDNKVITISIPTIKDTGLYNYHVKYSIANGSSYYVKFFEHSNSSISKTSECLKVINGMNQIFNMYYSSDNQYGVITLYEDKACKKEIKSISMQIK